MRRAVVVLALVFVLALGVVFSARNVGIAQTVNGQPATCTPESLPQYTSDENGNKLPRNKPGMIPPKQIRNLTVCTIDGTDTAEQIEGTDTEQLVDKIVGNGGNDTLMGLRGWNGLFGGEGKDTIEGGSGTDIVFAIDQVTQDEGADANLQTVDDTIAIDPTIEPQVDTITCGLGNDTVYADDIDKVAKDCERVKLQNPAQAKPKPVEPTIPVIHWFRRCRAGR